MIEIDPAVVMVVWAVFAAVMMIPPVVLMWLVVYDELKQRWGK